MTPVLPTGTGVVHLGLGAFFRAHGAVCIARAVEQSGGDWGILGVSLQSPATRDALIGQGFTYHAVEQGPQGEIPRQINILRGVLVAPENPQSVLDVMSDPAIELITLTITEKGYCHTPTSGKLNLDHPDIQHELAHPLPRTAPGFLVRSLALRHAKGIAAPTVMSCDNLPHNGRVLRDVVVGLAEQVNPDLADWIAENVRFPATMVDRIVPATKPEDIARLAASGITDAAPVLHEPFLQWVIEDDFAGPHPDFASAGAQLVSDVAPFENMKLRMLNGTHSALAYLGYLAGHETISDTVADPVFAAFVRHLWGTEIIPSLTPPEKTSLTTYADQLFERYQNPAIRHRCWQIAMDGSQKLPQRILSTLSDNLAAGRESPGLCLAVAAWMQYVSGRDLAGQPIDVRDPLAADLDARAAQGVHALLAQTAIFPPALARALENPLNEAYARLKALGARQAIEGLA